MTVTVVGFERHKIMSRRSELFTQIQSLDEQHEKAYQLQRAINEQMRLLETELEKIEKELGL